MSQDLQSKSIHKSDKDTTHKFYEGAYKELGFGAQRKYPNEEFSRFMGRNFFSIPKDQRQNVKILETGCGSGANLWMIAKEGFQAYGIDLSPEGIELARSMLGHYKVSANLSAQDMTILDFPDHYFDAVVDVFSSYCLTKEQGKIYLNRVAQVLKPGGLFFSYFPSKGSDAYQFPENATLIDSDTLNSILRKDAAFTGQTYPFRFMHPREYEKALVNFGFEVPYLETISRTYNKGKEYFEFVVIEGRKR